jgi:hypothetical protein
MLKQKLKTLLSVIAILAALAVLYFRVFPRTPPFDARPHRALGEALAEQAAKAVGEGGRIILIAPDTSAFKYPAVELQLKAFHKALRKMKLSIGATNLIKFDPIRLARVPPEFTELLRKQSETDVVVSWLGPLSPAAEQKVRLPEKHARVVALCSGGMPRQINLKAFFEEGLLDVAIISRVNLPRALPQSDNLHEWFSHFFEIVTPKNVSDLPALAEGTPR